MIKRNALFRLSIGLLLTGVFGGILLDTIGFFPHATAYLLSIPIASNSTEFGLGWILSGMTITGLVTLFLSLHHHQGWTTFACLTAVILTPYVF
ncbi:hypothetical protein [Exiguobacterium acetylicum]|uniref:hypothetical protein n=1 Tax=Exiguobacterium acetylicum TaxID=41170 RepID=UPI001CA71C53|nr:hypothetical protein [Exiguobacterium acetylicum]QZY88323.1 hypothetical protein K7G97_08305 [Exiguobacterium acetylicum]